MKIMVDEKWIELMHELHNGYYRKDIELEVLSITFSALGWICCLFVGVARGGWWLLGMGVVCIIDMFNIFSSCKDIFMSRKCIKSETETFNALMDECERLKDKDVILTVSAEWEKV